MAIKTEPGRQWALVALTTIKHTDFANGGQVAVDLPQGAIVTGGFIKGNVSFNAGTSATLKIGDTADDNRYADAVDVKATSFTALTVTGYEHKVEEKLFLTLTAAGTAMTSGEADVVIEYIVKGREHTTQG